MEGLLDKKEPKKGLYVSPSGRRIALFEFDGRFRFIEYSAPGKCPSLKALNKWVYVGEWL